MSHSDATAESLTAYLPIDRTHALLRGQELPDRAEGAVLFADISGFTPLGEALVQDLGRLRGAEELTRQLNLVYGGLIAAVHAYQGSVIGFSGDAITCWFSHDLVLDGQRERDGRAGLRALSAAAAMQAAMQQFVATPTPSGATVTLAVKTAVVAGPVRRYAVGAPEHGLVDVLAGGTLDEVANAEQLAGAGEIIVSPALLNQVGQDILAIRTWRSDVASGRHYAVVEPLAMPVAPAPWPEMPEDGPEDAVVRAWLLPPVYERLRSGHGQFLAELRPATALFLSFTGIDHDADDDAGAKLDAVIRWVQDVLARYEGVLIQVTLGDKGSYLYAAFGAPQAHDDDPARGVGAAMDLAGMPQHLNFIREVRIGVTSGRMRTGAYGSPERRTYGVLGNKTNLAARLMTAAQPGQILCEEDLGRSASGHWTFRPLPPVRVKGKAEPVHVCEPIGRADRSQGTYEGHATLVGRQAELARLSSLLDTVAAGQHRLLIIAGEPGIGKSRLALELEHLGGERTMAVLHGAGQSIEQYTSYRAWRDVFQHFFAIEPSGSPQEAMAQVRRHMVELAPSQLEWLPLLDDVLGQGWEDTELTAALTPELRRQILFNLVRTLLQARAARTPLVVVLEDGQWLDQLSWSLVSSIAGDARLAGAALLLVLVTRPASESDSFAQHLAALRALPGIELMALNTLTAEETVALAAAHLGVPENGLPLAVEQLVRQAAHGNPFFAGELVFTLRDHGLVRVEPDPDRTGERLPNRCLVTGDLTRFAETLPDTVQGLVLARIDRLPAERQLALKVAAVIGRTFGYGPVSYLMASLSREIAAALREHLDALTRADLTGVETPEPDLSYVFNHIITQEVAYQTLLFAQRQQLHRRAAAWYETTFGDEAQPGAQARLAPFYPLLVYHYRQAEEPASERRYARLAGEHAARQFANADAAMYLSRALELAPTDAVAERYELLLARERVYDVQADRVRQQQDLAELEGLAALLDDAAAQAEVALRKARCFEYLGDFAQAFASVDQGLRFAPPDALEVVALKIMGAGLYHRQGRYREALEWCQDALSAPGLPSIHHLRAHAQSLAGLILTYMGQLGDALESLQLALRQYVQLEELPGQFDTSSNLGLSLFTRAGPGDWTQAYAYLRQAQSLAERMGDSERLARVNNNLGWLAYCLGDSARAIEHYDFSLQVWIASGGKVMSAIVRTNLGAAELARGDTETALALLRKAEVVLEDAGAVGQLAETRRYLAQARLAAGDLLAAQEAAQSALALSRAAEAPLEEAVAWRVLGQIAFANGKLADAISALETSRALLADQGNRYELAQTLTSLGEVLAAANRREEAAADLAAAVEVFAELDTSRDLALATRILASTTHSP